jgi:thiaminase/transcriptional activator TenA
MGQGQVRSNTSLRCGEIDMVFTDQLWQLGKPLLERMITHPFNRELAAGTLTPELFCHYLQQDDLYIKDYTRVLLHLSTRTDDEVLKDDLLFFAEDSYQLEKMMHDSFFKHYGIVPTVEKTHACAVYTGFLSDCSHNDSVAVALAALLPCFWYYYEVGLSVLGTSSPDNPYRDWIDLYSGAGFKQQVQCLLRHVDIAAENADPLERKIMRDAFITSSLCELNFWEGIYHYLPGFMVK